VARESVAGNQDCQAGSKAMTSVAAPTNACFTTYKHAAQLVRLKNGRLIASRTACLEDRSAVQQFIRGLSVRSRRDRFFSPIRQLPDDQLDALRSDTPGKLFLVGETLEGAKSRIVGLAQYAVYEPFVAELAVVIDDAWQRQGLGLDMLVRLAEHAACAGLSALTGFVLADNRPMLQLLSRWDCEIVSGGDPSIIRFVKQFDARQSSAQAVSVRT
jgi:GNAT superfamily N-acetyltransferase